MITDLLLIILNGMASGLLLLLPPWVIPLDTPTMNVLFGQFTSYNSVLPIAEIFAMSTLSFSLFIGMHAFKWAKASYNAVRGSGA